MHWTFYVFAAGTAGWVIYVGIDAKRRHDQRQAEIAERATRWLLRHTRPETQLLNDVALRAAHRREFAEADHERLCRAWNGHQRCSCYECDVLAEVAFDGASPVEAAKLITERRRAGETA